jgi:amino acid transporter
MVTIAILAVIAIYHSLSNKWANRINQLLVATKLVTLLTVICLGFAYAKASAERLNNKNENWFKFAPVEPEFFQNVGATEWIQRYITAMLTILFAYAGWNNLNCKYNVRKKRYSLAHVLTLYSFLSDMTDEYSGDLLRSNGGAVFVVTIFCKSNRHIVLHIIDRY